MIITKSVIYNFIDFFFTFERTTILRDNAEKTTQRFQFQIFQIYSVDWNFALSGIIKSV